MPWRNVIPAITGGISALGALFGGGGGTRAPTAGMERRYDELAGQIEELRGVSSSP